MEEPFIILDKQVIDKQALQDKAALVDISKYDYQFSLKNKIARVLWNITYLFLFRPFAPEIFKKWRLLLLKVFGAEIDWSVGVYASTKIWAPWNLKMEVNSCIGPKVDCYNQGKISIGRNTIISQKCYLCASSHDITDPKHTLIIRPIVIEDQVWIAADAFVGPGVKICQGAVVGARSAVFKEVGPWAVVRGNPATFVKERKINLPKKPVQAYKH